MQQISFISDFDPNANLYNFGRIVIRVQLQ